MTLREVMDAEDGGAPLPQEGDRLDTMDAVRWAREFMRLFGQRLHEVDESLMVGWFANAIMRGWDEARWKAKREQEGEKAPVTDPEKERLGIRDTLATILIREYKMVPTRVLNELSDAIAALLREPRYTHSDDCPMSGWPCMCAGKRASGESLPPKENV